jgi:predicted adenylyl cyclase CyaB
MARNLEIKARCDDLARAADVARAAGGEPRGVLDQVDTYFHAPHGRLKLRENLHLAPDGTRTASVELIAYRRVDHEGSRESTYSISRLEHADDFLAGLSAVLGVRVVVRKRRALWIVGATRVHLDEVADLGHFLELETVITSQPEADARREHDDLIQRLGIREPIAGSYSELLLAQLISA